MSSPARFTVSGPLEEEHGVPELGAGLSVAQTFANRRRRDVGEFSYYVRDVDGVGRAVVTKTAAGVIETRLVYQRRDLEEGAPVDVVGYAIEPAPADVVEYADELEGGQLGLAVAGESVELFKRPAGGVS